MLDIQLLRSNTAAVAERLARRGYDFDTARFDALEERRKSVQVKTEELQASRNSISKQIGALKGQGKHEEAQAAMDQVAQIKTDLEQAAADLEAVQKELDAWLLSIPNLPHEDVPFGKDETENVEVRKVGTPREFDFEIKDHVDLGEPLGLDFEAWRETFRRTIYRDARTNRPSAPRLGTVHAGYAHAATRLHRALHALYR